MISSLVPSDYPFGTLFLPFWCLLITLWYQLLTPLVHSRYLFISFGIPPFLFCLPFCYLLVATLVPSDCPFLWYLLPTHCYLLITSMISSDYPLWYLLVTPFATFCQPVCHLLVASLVPSDNPLVSSGYHLWSLLRSYCYLLITSLGPADNHLWYLLVTLFVAFFLPVCYILVASLVPYDNPLVPSGYLFGTFCLPLWYILITPLVELI
jgi:hypothetical protein